MAAIASLAVAVRPRSNPVRGIHADTRAAATGHMPDSRCPAVEPALQIQFGFLVAENRALQDWEHS
jgi:hypothetical protein